MIRQSCHLARHYHCRLTLITVGIDIPAYHVHELTPPEDTAYFLADVQILGDIDCHLAIGEWSAAKDTWAVISSTQPSLATFSLYCRRFGGIEPFFKDHKSGTFDLPKSRLRNAQALSCIFLLMSVAELLAIAVGFWLVKSGQRAQIDPHTRRGLSFLQLGIRRIQSLCYQQLPLPRFRAIPYGDPPPAYASCRKKARETRKIRFPLTFEL